MSGVVADLPSYGSGPEEHPYSCVLCKQRKVKCDRLDPACSNCIKASVECVYRAPDPPRRRKRKLSGSDLQARLKYCEELLEDHGIPVADTVDGETPNKAVKDSHESESTSDKHSSTHIKAVENRHNPLTKSNDINIKRQFCSGDLWNEIHELEPAAHQERTWLEDEKDKDTQPHEIGLSQSDADTDFLFGPCYPGSMRDFLPSYEDIWKLWKLYRENVDPIMKIIHIPSAEKIMAKGVNLPEALSKSEMALFMSILAAALNTIKQEECTLTFGQDRSSMILMLRRGARKALTRANFLGTMNFTVLQAFMIFLMSIRGECDHPSLWSMSGIAVRIGQRMGLEGIEEDQQSTPFEKEMRRRLWLQLTIFDSQIAEVSGCSVSWGGLVRSLNRPANVNDEELYPEMTELPPDREGPSDIMFTRMRYDFAVLIKRLHLYQDKPDKVKWSENFKEDQERAIQEMEELFANKYLRYVDPLIPIQFLITLTGRCMISRLRLLAGHPGQYEDRGASLPKAEQDRLFNLSLKTVEYELVASSSPMVKGFMWHFSMQTQFTALVYILSELRKRTSGAEVDKAWTQLEEIYKIHPELIEKGHRRFFWALGSLVLSAWKRRQSEYERLHGRSLLTPEFIYRLQVQRATLPDTQKRTGSEDNAGVFSTVTDSPAPLVPLNGTYPPQPRKTFGILPWGMEGDWDPSVSSSSDFDAFSNSPLNWAEWDEMLRDCERL